jgi:hypothetical protein
MKCNGMSLVRIGSIALIGYDEGLSTEAPIENGRKYNPDVIKFFTSASHN